MHLYSSVSWSYESVELADSIALNCLPTENNIDGCFMRAVLAVHSEHYDKSRLLIEQTRRQLDTMMTSLLAESYSRAYVPFIMVQQCAELEEIIDYRLLLRRAIADCAAEGGSSGDGGPVVPAVRGSFSGHSPANTGTSGAGAEYSSNRNAYTGMSPVQGHTSDSAARLSPTNRSASPMGGGAGHSSSGGGSISPIVAAQASPEVVQRKAFLTEKWRTRIRGCYSSGRAAIPFWKYLLNGRRMVLSETEDLDTWLDFVSLCRNGGNRELAERVLLMSDVASSQSHMHGYQSHFRSINGRPPAVDGAAGPESINSSTIIRTSGLASAATPAAAAGATTEASIIMDRRIRFAMLKQQWAVGDRLSALMGLESLIRQTTQSGSGSVATTDASYLTCLLKLGEWKIAVLDPGRPVDKTTRKEVLALYGRATSVDPNCYEAWHQWGLSNYRAIEEARALTAPTPSGGFNLSSMRTGRTPVAGRLPGALPGDSLSIVPLVVNSIKGLMRALTLGTKRYSSQVTQDMLCILSLWFRYGKIPDVNAVLESGLATVHLNTWLGVLPQLIARIDHPDPATCALLHNLLIRLGTKHSQAIVYPLFVAIKSPRGRRKEAAETLMNSLRQHSAKLITQALLVSQELVRVAILWEENWHLILEEAAKLFFGDGNIQGMLDLLMPLHNEILAGVNTLRESAFMQSHGNDLDDAWNCIHKYLAAMEEQKMPIPTFGSSKKNSANQRPEDLFLFQAWDYYFAVFKRINAQLPQLTALELQTCSPQLFNAHDLDLGVPGTYTVSGHAVRIKSFGSVVGIIRSKQRPRKLRIVGEDGQTFNFLLKVAYSVPHLIMIRIFSERRVPRLML
jgi:FKBP12-rapamycin complex-associated protein